MNSACILVVDDNAISRKLLRAILEAEHFRVSEAADGVEALEVLQRESITAIVSDILMPRMDGYRLCHDVRMSDKWSGLPFIMYSATYANASDRKLAMDMGANGFLRKPASSNDIVSALLSVMAKPDTATHTVLAPPGELAVMKQYSERLVHKLEERGAELAKTSRELQVSEIRYRTLAESADDSIFSLSRDGVMQYINTRGAEDFNLPARVVVGKAQSELFPAPIAEHNIALIEQVWVSKKPLFEENVRPFRGENRWHSTSLVPVKDEKGEVVSVMGIARDVTDRKRLDELRAQMSFSLSHELNTPLNGIVGIAELLRDGIDTMSKDEMREMIGLLSQSAARLDRLVQQNLDYAELELIASAPKYEAMPIRDVCTDLSGEVSTAAERVAASYGRRSDLQLDLSDASGVENFVIERRYLTRVVAELVDNAFKFSSSGKPVSLRLKVRKPQIEIAVTDKGGGMRSEQIAAIAAFKQFERKQREQQGVGLGLYLARRIVEMHGGTLQVDSTPAAGTRVTVMLKTIACQPLAKVNVG